MQGILEIQSSVQQGITSVESALTMLTEIYGFSEDVARDILDGGQITDNTNENEDSTSTGS